MNAILGKWLVSVSNALLLASALEFVSDAIWQFKHAAIWTATDYKTANNMESWAIGAHF
ncbi:MAG: hypothetical protein LW629_05305 [Burkholderiales bacterium]|jgi:hypothetical protein|nr:hypothetical protein [Burkholderiales bacterium]